MSSNEFGTYRTTKANMMRAYDRLPPAVRQALANAAFNYVPQPLLTRWRKGWPDWFIIKTIAFWDQQEIAGKSRRRKGRP